MYIKDFVFYTYSLAKEIIDFLFLMREMSFTPEENLTESHNNISAEKNGRTQGKIQEEEKKKREKKPNDIIHKEI